MPITRGLTFDDVLLVPNYANESRDDGHIATRLGEYWFKIPIISANMDTITGIDMAAAMAKLGGLGILHRFMSVEENVSAYKEVRKYNFSCNTGVSIGVGGSEIRRAEELYHAGARLFCVDIAHAHSKAVGKTISYLKKRYDDIYIIAGNVATREGANYLDSKGADAIKVGIGAGSVCTTREVTGFGVPQLTAIMDCARIDKPIIADGGIRTSGDAVKALAAGATMVMLGGMLAGTDEICGYQGTYRGMASKEAREAREAGGITEAMARAGEAATEGISITVDSKGSVAGVIKEIIGGIKSGLSYCGAKNLDELRRKAVFMEVTSSSTKEGTPHGLG